MKNGYKVLLGLVFLIMFVLLVFAWFREPEKNTVFITHQDTIIIRDTIRLWMPAKVQYKRVYVERLDTVRERMVTEVKLDTNVYIACIDTTVGKTTIEACFFHPKKYFSIVVSSQPDTVRQTIIVPKSEERKNAWWQDAGKVSIGVVLGFLLGRSIR